MNSINQKDLDKLEKIKEQLGSNDEELVKQAITLLLDLGLKEETEKEFGLFLDHSDGEQLIAGDELISLLRHDESSEDNSWDDDSWGDDSSEDDSSMHSNLIEACLLALLISSGRIGKQIRFLALSLNPYFDEFDLLDRLEGIERLELNHFEESRVVELVSKIESLCVLQLVGMNDLSYFVEIENLDDVFIQCKRIVLENVNVSAVIDSVCRLQALESLELELKYGLVDIKWLSSILDDEDILEILEKITQSQESLINDQELEALLALEEINWGVHKKRWFTVCRKMRIIGVKHLKRVKGISFKMMYCPAGEFWMGSRDGGLYKRDNEQPRHKVKISKGSWVGETQVTQELWCAVMGNNPSKFKGKQLPVEKVSWFDCVRFCNELSKLEGLTPVYKINEINDSYDDSNTNSYYNSKEKSTVEWNRKANGYRLLTEAEWEYVSKAGTEFIYAGSNDIDEIAWCRTNSNHTTHPVAQLKANAWGLSDCSGNVYEWCHDSWDDSIHKNRTGTVVDPCPYENGLVLRSVRGGGWGYVPDVCRVAGRGGLTPDCCFYDLGFRFSKPSDG